MWSWLISGEGDSGLSPPLVGRVVVNAEMVAVGCWLMGNGEMTDNGGAEGVTEVVVETDGNQCFMEDTLPSPLL